MLGLACTGDLAAGGETWLSRSPVIVTCEAGTATVDPGAGPGNLDEDDGISSTGGSPPLFGAAVYQGAESLGFNKRYWNVLLGLDDAAAGCVVTASATASPEELVGGATPAGTTWPIIEWNVTLTAPTTGARACETHPVNGAAPFDGVATRYADPDAPETFPRAFGPTLPSAMPCLAGEAGCALTSCLDIVDAGLDDGDGVYVIDVDGADSGDASFDVYCDMTTDGGGWTLISKAIATTRDHYSATDVNLAALSDLGFTQGGTFGDAKRAALNASFHRFTCGSFTAWAYAVDPGALINAYWETPPEVMRWSLSYATSPASYTLPTESDCGSCGGPATDLGPVGVARNWGRSTAAAQVGCGLYHASYGNDGYWWAK